MPSSLGHNRNAVLHADVSGQSTRDGGLFGKRFDPLAASRSEAFQALKPACLAIMAKPVHTAASYAGILQNLLQLRRLLAHLHDTLPRFTFNPSLINYASFPLTHFLQRNEPQTLPERILEALFDNLTFLFERWKECEGGIDLRAWEEMWVMTVVVLGGSLSEARPPAEGTGTRTFTSNLTRTKGKGREIGEELQMAGLAFLRTLLQSDCGTEDDEDPDPFLDRRHPSQEMLASIFAVPHPNPARDGQPNPTSKRSLLPILFHTVNTLLDLVSPEANPNYRIRATALRILRDVINTYLTGRPEILATLLPGIVSTCVRSVVDEGKAKGIRADVGEELCGLLADIITETVGDALMREKGVLKDRLTTLDELGAESSGAKGESIGHPPGMGPSIRNGAFPPLTKQYLSFTSTQLLVAFTSAAPYLLNAHSSAVRLSLVHMAQRVLGSCSESLASCRNVLFRALLRSALDDMPDVRDASATAITGIFTSDKHYRILAEAILRGSLAELPRLILSHDEAKVKETVLLVIATAELTRAGAQSGQGDNSSIWRNLLGADFALERWSWPLLVCLELGAEGSSTSRGRGNDALANRAWQISLMGHQAISMLLGPSVADGADPSPLDVPAFPQVEFVHVEHRESASIVGRMFEAIGEAAGREAMPVLEHFLAVARSKHNGPDVARAASSLWIIERLLIGVARTVVDREGKKRLRKLVRNVVMAAVSMDDDDFDAEDVDKGDIDLQDAEQESGALVEQKKGVFTVVTLLAKPSRTTGATKVESRRLQLRAQRQLLSLRALSLVATCAEVLSSAFRPLLLSSLYFLLSHLGSRDDGEAEFAGIALRQVAYHSGYASPQNLLLDNIDYVINAVSQRMTFKRLSPLAPAVLVSMISLAGEAIVPLVQDVVDDIFEVLDEYHGYEALASTYLAVLDTLLKAMAKDSDLDGWQPKLSTSARMKAGPDPETDFAKLETWYKGRATAAEATLDQMLENAPAKDWTKVDSGAADGDRPPSPPSGIEQDPEIPATRTQEVCTQVLAKAGFYLTHPSAFIRARVLSLMASGIPVLIVGDRESDVLPIIHRCWPYLLNRLQDVEPYVVVEAAGLIACLARWAGDFMSRRILEDAWPILKELLESQRQLDAASALTRRNDPSGSTSPFTTSHRLHLSILTALRYVAQEVPVADDLLWEMILLFRPFLDSRGEAELRHAAVAMYRMMAKRDEDAVWLALSATTGRVKAESLRYLLVPGLSITSSMDDILT